MIFIPIVLFLVLLSAITFFGYRQYVRPAKIYQRLNPAVAEQESEIADLGTRKRNLSIRLFESLGKAIPFGNDDSATRRELISAGFRTETAITVFSGIRICATVLLPVIVFTFRYSLTKDPTFALLLPIGSGVLGYIGPGMVLERLVKKRQKTLRLSLPDALDLMVVAVEAGLGLDQAIHYSARELKMAHKDLCDELSLMSLEIRAGTRRSDAFRNLAQRTGEEELKKLVSMLIQTDRFGTSVADSLRTHSDFMRTRRRQDAEERAAKVGVKLVFPIFFFLLPTMILVSAGPGILQVMNNLIPMMKNVGH